MASPSPDIITFGETMALLLPNQGKGIEHAKTFESSFGGAESNLAIGLARLGVGAGWFGRLGDDPLGRTILKGIRGEGVDVSRAALVDGEPTGLMLRDMAWGKSSVYYYRKLSAASKMTPADLDEAYIKQAKILHITGITPALSESCRETVFAAVDIARRHGVKVSFDPNLRLKLWSLEEAKPVLQRLAEQADYYLPGYDELQLLYGTDDFESIVAELRMLKAVSVVKGAGQETLVVGKDRIERVPFFPVKQVVDTVGAGDGFCAGFLSGVVRGESLVEAVRIGSLVGSLVVQGVGDWESIPPRSIVEAELGLRKHVER
ncbi:sugar kinase [Paenibacillus sp.]|uniref:sugar kinase n=1 Tax=Paenibacillus sp. TaxID=58172 RepID=UPI002D53168A|nr:sugar kinase [Paenibacillus sp.]HZG54856.1 sugar kinase [Paenibacillus sp.]